LDVLNHNYFLQLVDLTLSIYADFFYLCLFVTVSQIGGALGRYHPAGEKRYPPAARRNQGEHSHPRARLLRLPQHHRDLQTGGAAGQHRHASTPGQQRLRAGPLAAQAQEEVAQEGVGAQEVRENERGARTLSAH